MKKIFTLLVFTFLLYSNSGWATIYYSYRFGGGGSAATTLTNWMDEIGNFPSSFGNPGDEFHISPGETMSASSAWNVAGKLVIEEGATFNAGRFNHTLLVDMLANARYMVVVNDENFDNPYSNLTLGATDHSSIFRISMTAFPDFNLRPLSYPTLQITGDGFIAITSPLTIQGDLQLDGGEVILANTLTINQNLNINSGSFSIAAANTLNVFGDVTIAGGTFNGKPSLGGTSTSNIKGNLNITSGIFNAAGSSSAGSAAIYNIDQDLFISGGVFNGVTASANANSFFNISGNFKFISGTYNPKPNGTGNGLTTISLIGTGDISSVSMANNSNQIVKIEGAYGLQSNFTVGNELNLVSGNLSLNGHTLTLNNALTIASGTLTGDNSAGITFGAASVGASLPSVTLGTLTINRSGQTIELAGNVTIANNLGLSAGTLSIGANTLTLSGGITGSGTLTGGTSSNLIANGFSPTSLSLPALTVNDFTINRSSGVSLNGPLTINGTLYLTTGQIENSVNNIILANNATISRNEGTLAAAPVFGDLINIAYTGINQVNTGHEIPTDPSTLNNLTVSKTGGLGLVLNTDLTVNGNLTIAPSSKLNGGAQWLTVKGNWINNGTFTPATGTVEFAGSTVLSGSVINTTFHHLSLAPGASLTVPASSTTTLTGDFTVAPSSTFHHNNSTIVYGGTGTQNIAGINYYNLTSTNTGARILNDTIGIENNFTPGANTYIATGSTINYNGSNQTISLFSYYNNLILSNSGIKTPAGTILSVNDLTISGSAVLAGNGKTINVAGNWSTYSPSAFAETNSTVVFNGNFPQSVSTSGEELFYDLTINSNSTVTLNSLVTVTRQLALTKGTLISGGNLTVDLNTGNIAYFTGDAGSVSGTLKIKKEIGSSKTHYLASPLNGTTANDFADNTQVINPSTNLTRLYEYVDGDWSPIDDLNTPLSPLKAYSLYFTAPTTLDFTGTYNHGSTPSVVNYPNTSSDFQMIGNPFPSTIDWTSPGWSKTNINDAIYYWDAANTRYATYVNGLGSNGGTPYIPALQGFFVTTTGTGGSASISMNNSVRTTSQTPSLWRTSATTQPVLKLTAQNGSNSDETVVRFSEDASDLFDGSLDALKLKNAGNNPNLFTLTKGKSYAINSLPLNYIDSTIPLKLEVPVTGTYVISANQFTGFDTTDIILEDRLLNISYDLKSSDGYSVTLAKGDTASRLFIKFRRADVVTSLPDHTEGKVTVTSTGKTVNVYFANIAEKEASVIFLNLIGQEVGRAENVPVAQGIYSKDLNVSPGIYLVKVKAGNTVYTEKIYINH